MKTYGFNLGSANKCFTQKPMQKNFESITAVWLPLGDGLWIKWRSLDCLDHFCHIIDLSNCSFWIADISKFRATNNWCSEVFWWPSCPCTHHRGGCDGCRLARSADTTGITLMTSTEIMSATLMPCGEEESCHQSHTSEVSQRSRSLIQYYKGARNSCLFYCLEYRIPNILFAT